MGIGQEVRKLQLFAMRRRVYSCLGNQKEAYSTSRDTSWHAITVSHCYMIETSFTVAIIVTKQRPGTSHKRIPSLDIRRNRHRMNKAGMPPKCIYSARNAQMRVSTTEISTGAVQELLDRPDNAYNDPYHIHARDTLLFTSRWYLSTISRELGSDLTYASSYRSTRSSSD